MSTNTACLLMSKNEYDMSGLSIWVRSGDLEFHLGGSGRAVNGTP